MNRLGSETSPYLRQHKDNPVEWYPWGEQAFARAQAEDKPVLLSVGYSACHWCHVMAHESFESPEIAALMNEHFVNVKVDREERPDVDSIYMDAVQAMTGRGGWPMTVFLTPDGRPFYGGTYFPPVDRHGMPGFGRLLLAVAEAYRDRRDELEEQAVKLADAIAEHAMAPASTEDVASDHLRAAAANLQRAADLEHGGFGAAPKFPQAMSLDASLRLGLLDVVRTTLTAMSFGGMYDQIGGGFHRYSTDAVWLVPHFEKMLYDQALLATLYVHGWQALGDAWYRTIALEICDYVLREMRSPGGGLYSSQDADSEGEEGKFFVWELEEVAAIAPDLVDVLGITSDGNFDGRNILTRHDTTDVPDQRRALYEARAQRVHPGLDDKVLVAWNSLMGGALTRCGSALRRPDIVRGGEEALRFVEGEMRRADGRLSRAWKDGRAGGITAFCEDYANHADALVDAYEATFDRWYLDKARETYEQAELLFTNPDGPGWFSTGSDAEALIHRPKELLDNAVPSGASSMTRAGLRLALHYGDEALAARPLAWLRATSTAMARQPLGFGHLLGAAHFALGPVLEVAFIGDDPALRAPVFDMYLPNRAVAGLAPADDLPLLAGKTLVDGRAAAYVCRDYVCDRPVTSASELTALLGP